MRQVYGARSWLGRLIGASMLLAGSAAAQPQPGYPPNQAPAPYPSQPPPSYPPNQPPPGGYPPARPPGSYPPGSPPSRPYPPPGQSPGAGWGYSAPPPPRTHDRSRLEIGTLYGVSVVYGAGLGIWLDAEIGIEDPAVRLIPPTLLGLAAPTGVFFLDRPTLPEGMPAAITAGLVIGAGEGLGIAGTQRALAPKDRRWGFRGLSRSVALGATVGGAAGYVVGYFQEPSPELSGFVTSGVFWGTAVGMSMGYGASKESASFDESASVGGLIGFNVGLAATAGLSTVFVPSWRQVAWMWAGGGIGAAASLPVFFFYIGDHRPPARRGLVFTGTATLLGTAAGGIFSSMGSSEHAGSDPADRPSRFASVTYVTPMSVPGGAGLSIGGVLQ